MTDVNQNFDMPEDIKPSIPSGINVLTILTFIGCALGFLATIYQVLFAKRNLARMEEMVNSGKFDEMPSFLKKMYSPEMIEMARKQYENRVPIAIITLLAIALCFIGAMQMRKLKMQGYYLYLTGEILPLIATLVFLGIGALTGFFGIITVCFILLFIILYSAQRKHLVNK